jgi:hypothetical protein
MSALVWSFSPATHAQTQASCTFTVFSVFLPHTEIVPFGINDFSTVVGGTDVTPEKGVIRWANGGLTFPTRITSLANRNDSGVSIGYTATQKAILLSGSTVTPITLATRLKTYKFLNVDGINDWGSIVGYYTGRCFPRFQTLEQRQRLYPQRSSTLPRGELGNVSDGN